MQEQVLPIRTVRHPYGLIRWLPDVLGFRVLRRLTVASGLQERGICCRFLTPFKVFIDSFPPKDPVSGDDDDLHLGRIYKSMWAVCKLKRL